MAGAGTGTRSVVPNYDLTTLAHANTYLGLTADGGPVDAYINSIIDRTSDIIENALHNKIIARLNVKERHDGKRQENIYFKQFPVLAVNLDELIWTADKKVTRADGGSFLTDGFAVADRVLVQNSDLNSGLLTIATDGVAALVLTFDETIVADTKDDNVILSHCRELWVDDTKIDEDDYEVYSDHIYYPGGFYVGHGNVRITYYGGHTTLPDDVERMCFRIVKLVYDKNEGVKSEKLGPYSITYIDTTGDIDKEIRSELTTYMNVVI